MKTVSKNSKEFNEILSLKGWSMFNEYNGFRPEEVVNPPYTDRIKKIQVIDGKYVITVSPNLWYNKNV
jgi:hypothetical protein